MDEKNLNLIEAVDEAVLQEAVDSAMPVVDRSLTVKMTFKEEGLGLEISSNLSALEQLGAIEIFKAHLLASALGKEK